VESHPRDLTRGERRTGAAIAAPVGVAILTFVAFIPVLRAGFVSWDDDKNFTDNPMYRGLGADQLHWMWTTFHMGHYVPLSWMTLGLDYRLWGMNPAGYHLSNLLLHTASAVIVYVLARRLLYEQTIHDGGPGSAHAQSSSMPFLAAAFAALFFGVHPLRVESVAWVTERRDVLSGFFYFSSVLAYLHTDDERHRGRWYAAALALFAAALLSKASAMTLPAVLLLLEIYPLRRLGGGAGWTGAEARRVYRQLVPFALFAGGAAVLSIVALHPPNQLSFSQKLAVSAFSLLFYATKTFVPTGLSPLYEMPRHIDPLEPRYVAGYVFTLVLAAAAWRARRRWPAATIAVAAFVLITLPMLGVVQNGPQIAADRYTYDSAPAVAVITTAGLVLAARLASGSVASALGAAAILALSALTWTQSGVWHDSKSLWSRVLAVDSTSAIAHSAMANVLYRENRVEDGLEHSRRAIELAPEFAEGYNALGVGLARERRVADAAAAYEKALALKPAFDEAETNLGAVLSEQGDQTDAIVHFARGLALNPSSSNAQVDWGNALVRLGRMEEAIQHYAAALRLRPDNADAHHNWGVALAREGRFDAAEEQFQMALAIDPGHSEAREYLRQARDLARRSASRP
jgi:tetratricopeptide (TPR) repeat protein